MWQFDAEPRQRRYLTVSRRAAAAQAALKFRDSLPGASAPGYTHPAAARMALLRYRLTCQMFTRMWNVREGLVQRIRHSTGGKNTLHSSQILFRIHSHSVIHRLGDMDRNPILQKPQLFQALAALQL